MGGKKDPYISDLCATVDIAIVSHYLNIVNVSEFCNIKSILISLFVVYDLIRPENWGDSNLSVFNVFCYYFEEFLNNLILETYIA